MAHSPFGPMPPLSLPSPMTALPLPSSLSQPPLLTLTVYITFTPSSGKALLLSFDALPSFSSLTTELTNRADLSRGEQRLLSGGGVLMKDDESLLSFLTTDAHTDSGADSAKELFLFSIKQLSSQPQSQSVASTNITEIESRIRDYRIPALREFQLPLSFGARLHSRYHRSPVLAQLSEYDKIFYYYKDTIERMIDKIDDWSKLSRSFVAFTANLTGAMTSLSRHCHSLMASEVTSGYDRFKSEYGGHSVSYDAYVTSYEQWHQNLALVPIIDSLSLSSPYSQPHTVTNTLQDYCDANQLKRQVNKFSEEKSKIDRRVERIDRSREEMLGKLMAVEELVEQCSKPAVTNTSTDTNNDSDNMKLMSATRKSLMDSLNHLLAFLEAFHSFVDTINDNPQSLSLSELESLAVAKMIEYESYNSQLKSRHHSQSLAMIVTATLTAINDFQCLNAKNYQLQSQCGELIAAIEEMKGRISLQLSLSHHLHTDYFQNLPAIQLWPEAYVRAVSEIRRRKLYQSRLSSNVREMVATLSPITESESRRRSQWYRQWGQSLPQSLVGPLNDRCSYVSLTLYDCDDRLPEIEEKQLIDIQSKLPHINVDIDAFADTDTIGRQSEEKSSVSESLKEEIKALKLRIQSLESALKTKDFAVNNNNTLSQQAREQLLANAADLEVKLKASEKRIDTLATENSSLRILLDESAKKVLDTESQSVVTVQHMHRTIKAKTQEMQTSKLEYESRLQAKTLEIDRQLAELKSDRDKWRDQCQERINIDDTSVTAGDKVIFELIDASDADSASDGASQPVWPSDTHSISAINAPHYRAFHSNSECLYQYYLDRQSLHAVVAFCTRNHHSHCGRQWPRRVIGGVVAESDDPLPSIRDSGSNAVSLMVDVLACQEEFDPPPPIIRGDSDVDGIASVVQSQSRSSTSLRAIEQHLISTP